MLSFPRLIARSSTVSGWARLTRKLQKKCQTYWSTWACYYYPHTYTHRFLQSLLPDAITFHFHESWLYCMFSSNELHNQHKMLLNFLQNVLRALTLLGIYIALFGLSTFIPYLNCTLVLWHWWHHKGHLVGKKISYINNQRSILGINMPSVLWCCWLGGMRASGL